MNDYEMMNQRVDQLRAHLARLHHEEESLAFEKQMILTELLDTRRQITDADKARISRARMIAENIPPEIT